MLWGSSALSEFHTSLSKVLTLWHCVKVKQRYQFQFFFHNTDCKGGYFKTYQYLANGKNPIPSYRPSGNLSTTSGMFWPLKVFEQCVSLHSFHTFWRNNKTPKTEEYSKYTSCLTFKWLRRDVLCFLSRSRCPCCTVGKIDFENWTFIKTRLKKIIQSGTTSLILF